ncbi:energy-coupling factor ABC transporter substrate-binding protein [Archaeoglobales archaeon]|nr:MAG: energy-coupling factor ABC transporter substrate-binding protein [Archaeoglobales archaeon]
MKKLLLSVLVLLTIFAFISVAAGEEWAGADEQAEEAIKEINPNYEPWFSPVWEPPSGEIESFLFSLQAAIGALLIGYFLGYYRGAKHARNA